MFDRIRQQCRPVCLEDRQIIDAIRAKAGHKLSSHAFPSLYVWQKEMKLLLYLNSTPIVRQYGILLTNGVLFYAKRETK